MPDTTPVLAVLSRLAEAWNAADADAYGDLFTPDATGDMSQDPLAAHRSAGHPRWWTGGSGSCDTSYVTFDGQVLTGRAAITDVHRWLFDGPLRGSVMGDASTGAADPTVRFLRPDVAHVVTAGAVRAGGTPEAAPDRDSVPSFVLVDDGAGWRVTAFHNCRVVTR